MAYVIGVDLSDPVVLDAVQMLSRAWLNATITDYFVAGDYPPNVMGDPVYVVGHGNAVTGLAHVDLRAVNTLDARFRELLADSPQAVLVACFLGSDPTAPGFQAQPFAETLSAQLEVEVVAATGPVMVDTAAATLTVGGLEGQWVLFDDAEQYACTNPIGDGGSPANGTGDGSVIDGPDAARRKKRPRQKRERSAARPTESS
jgi:hypothetical protein